MIKVVEEGWKREEKYPYLGISDVGNIVLFTEKNTGTLLRGETHDLPLGDWSECWCEEEDFEKYKGILSLENM